MKKKLFIFVQSLNFSSQVYSLNEKVEIKCFANLRGVLFEINLIIFVSITRWTQWRRKWAPLVLGQKIQRRLLANSAAKSSTLPEENTTAGRNNFCKYGVYLTSSISQTNILADLCVMLVAFYQIFKKNFHGYYSAMKYFQELWRYFLRRLQRQQDATSQLFEANARMRHLLHLADQ